MTKRKNADRTLVKRILGIPSLLARGLISLYKKSISPLLPAACRFHPTCSQYCSQALEKHGLFRGGWLGMKRLLRCNPLFKGGYDPVPDSWREAPDANPGDRDETREQSSKENETLQCEKCTSTS